MSTPTATAALDHLDSTYDQGQLMTADVHFSDADAHGPSVVHGQLTVRVESTPDKFVELPLVWHINVPGEDASDTFVVTFTDPDKVWTVVVSEHGHVSATASA